MTLYIGIQYISKVRETIVEYTILSKLLNGSKVLQLDGAAAAIAESTCDCSVFYDAIDILLVIRWLNR